MYKIIRQFKNSDVWGSFPTDYKIFEDALKILKTKRLEDPQVDYRLVKCEVIDI